MTCELRTFYDNFNYIQSRRQLVSCTPTCMNKANLRLTINSRCKCAIEYFEDDLFKCVYVLFKGSQRVEKATPASSQPLEITYLEKVLDPHLCLFGFFFFGLNSEHFMLDYLDLVGLVGVSKN